MDIELNLDKIIDQVVCMILTQEITQNNKISKEDKDYIFNLIRIFIKHGVKVDVAINILNDISNISHLN